MRTGFWKWVNAVSYLHTVFCNVTTAALCPTWTADTVTNLQLPRPKAFQWWRYSCTWRVDFATAASQNGVIHYSTNMSYTVRVSRLLYDKRWFFMFLVSIVLVCPWKVLNPFCDVAVAKSTVMQQYPFNEPWARLDKNLVHVNSLFLLFLSGWRGSGIKFRIIFGTIWGQGRRVGGGGRGRVEVNGE